MNCIFYTDRGSARRKRGRGAAAGDARTMAEGKKDLLRQIPRVKLWLVLMLTLAFSAVLLIAAHLTHSLTLRVEAYHALYNVLTLSGCLLAMKVSSGPQSLHNTFGWARLEVLSMLTTLLFLTALCFSVTIESVQTALHVGHQDAMHHPLSVMGLGAVGLVLNALVFFLIGGYTHHQGCFLEMRDSGSVWVGRQVTQEAVQAGRRTLSSNDALAGSNSPQGARQRCKEVIRDTCGLVIMEVCAALVHWDDGGVVALYIDPALAVTSAALLVWLSHPYGKECCHILLQTIPGHIDVENFQRRVMKEFPAIVSVHHLHIWTFTPSKVVATAHVVFASPRVYLATKAALRQFFLAEGITQVTIQPECLSTLPGGPLEDPSACLLRCKHQQCHERECCLSCSPHPLLSVTSSSSSPTWSQGAQSRVAANGEGSDGGCEATGQQGDGAADGGGGGDSAGSSGIFQTELGSGRGAEGGTGKATAPTTPQLTMKIAPPPPPPPTDGQSPPTPPPSSASSHHSEGNEERPSEENPVDNDVHYSRVECVAPSYADGDGTEVPLLRPSPAEDAPLIRPLQQDGASRDNNGSTSEEPTDRTCLLPQHSV